MMALGEQEASGILPANGEIDKGEREAVNRQHVKLGIKISFTKMCPLPFASLHAGIVLQESSDGDLSLSRREKPSIHWRGWKQCHHNKAERDGDGAENDVNPLPGTRRIRAFDVDCTKIDSLPDEGAEGSARDVNARSKWLLLTLPPHGGDQDGEWLRDNRKSGKESQGHDVGKVFAGDGEQGQNAREDRHYPEETADVEVLN